MNYNIENSKKSLTLSKIRKTNTMKLIPLDLILVDFPFVSTEMKWSKEDIRFFYDNHLLLGVTDSDDNLSIDKDSFESLIKYHRSIAEKQKNIKF